MEDPPELETSIPHPTRNGVMIDTHPFPNLDWLRDQVVIRPMPSYDDNAKHHVEARANVRSWVRQGLIIFGPMPEASFVPPKVPARLERLISIVPSPEAVNSKRKGSKRAKYNHTPKD
jgi:hypothetical protein